MKVQHYSEITGSTWHVEFDKDYEVKSCYLETRAGKLTKVILTKARDWRLWKFFTKNFLIHSHDND